MGFWDLIRWALRQIRNRLLESILIILGIGLGVAVICGVVGLIEGFDKSREDLLNSGHAQTFQISPAGSGWNPSPLPLTLLGAAEEEPIKLEYADYLKLQEASIAGLELVWIAQTMSFPKSENQEYPDFGDDYEAYRKWANENMLSISVATPEIFKIGEFTLVKGDLFRPSDLEEKNHVVVLGDEMAEGLYGDADPLGKSFEMEYGTYTVIGVVHKDFDQTGKRRDYIAGVGMEDQLNNRAYIPYTSFETPWGNDLNEIHLKANNQVELTTFYNRLNQYNEDTYQGKLTINGTFLYLDESKKNTFAITKTIGIFACAALLIAAINILNLMLARVLRRTKSVGISAAMGASRSEIFKLFLVEALLLGLMGSIIGVLLAWGGLKLLGKLVYLQLSLSPLSWLVGVGLAVVVSLLIGLYPANQAARIAPVDALRTD